MPVTMSHFSVLAIEDDSDTEPVERAREPATTTTKTSRTKTKRNRKRNKDKPDSDLQALAFGFRRGSKAKSGHSHKAHPQSHQSDPQSHQSLDRSIEEKSSAQQECDQFDRDIQQALLQSQLEYEQLTISNNIHTAEEASSVSASFCLNEEKEEDLEQLTCEPLSCQIVDPLPADTSCSVELELVKHELQLSRQQCQQLRDAADTYKNKFRRLLALMKDCEVSEKVRLAVTASKAASERDTALRDNAALSSQLASLSVQLEEEKSRRHVLVSQLRRSQEAKRRCHDNE